MPEGGDSELSRCNARGDSVSRTEDENGGTLRSPASTRRRCKNFRESLHVAIMSSGTDPNALLDLKLLNDPFSLARVLNVDLQGAVLRVPQDSEVKIRRRRSYVVGEASSKAIEQRGEQRKERSREQSREVYDHLAPVHGLHRPPHVLTSPRTSPASSPGTTSRLP